MSLGKKLREATQKYPGVDVFIRQGILHIAGITEEEFIEKSLSSSYFLPRDGFAITYQLGDPPELIRKKGMADVAVIDEERKWERG